MNTTENKPLESILRAKQVAAMLGISRTTLWYLLDKKSKRYDPNMPRPFKTTNHSLGFKASEIAAYIEHLAQNRL